MPLPDNLLCLSDDQLQAIMVASQPLPPERRSEFLQRVADELGRCNAIGDGAIYRVVRAMQARFYVPPERVGVVGTGSVGKQKHQFGGFEF
jgi:hypothetical protein